MNKRFGIAKLLPVWLAISAAVIIAGIVMYVLMGFNFAATETKTVEISYNAVVTINEKEEELASVCEDAFSSKGVVYQKKERTDELNPNYFSATGETVLRYTFSGDVSDEALAAALDAVRTQLSEKGAVYTDVYVSPVHTLTAESFYEAAWRGAVAIAVGAVVALIYIGFRFGLGSALTGAAVCVHDVFLTLALLAVTRLPLYAYTPLLFAAIAAFLSLLLWMVQCMKMRENFKDPAYVALSAEEAVQESYRSSKKTGLILSGVLFLVFLVLGAVAAKGVMLFMLPALIPVLVSAYSSLVVAPAVYVPIKAKFDRMKSMRKRYNGKAKAEKAE